MKKRIARVLALCLVFTLSVILVNCSGGGGATGGSQAESDFKTDPSTLPAAAPASYQTGTPAIVAEATINDQGGTLTGEAGTPVEGIVVTVPAGALTEPTTLSLGYDEGGVFTNVKPEEQNIVIVLRSSGVTKFKKPLKVTFPYTDPVKFPVSYYINPDGKLEILAPLPLDRAAGRGGFITWHASYFTSLNSDGSNYEPAYNQFDPRLDGFIFSNRPPVKYAEDGRCWGMTYFSKWYKQKAGGGLAEKFLYKVPTKTTDNCEILGQEIVATRAHNSVAYFTEVNQAYVQDALEFIIFVKDALSRGAPAVMVGLGSDAGAHAVLAIGYTDNQIALYDPNYPGQIMAIDYMLDPPILRYVEFTEFAVMGNGELQLNEDFEHLLSDANAQFHGENETKIEVTSHTYGQKVSTDDVSLEGRIHSGQVQISEIEARVVYDDGSESAPVTLPMPPNDDAFKLPLTLKKGSNVVRFKTRGFVAYRGTEDIPNAIYESEDVHLDGFQLYRETNGTGTFTIDWASAFTGTVFRVEADAALNFKDDGSGETNYTLSGQVTMKTGSFLFGDDPDTVCTLDSAVLPIQNQAYFKVLKSTPPAVRWSFQETWPYTCTTVDGFVFSFKISVLFETATGLGCSQLVDVPVTDPLAPAGTFTSDCSGLGTATATWDFSTN